MDPILTGEEKKPLYSDEGIKIAHFDAAPMRGRRGNIFSKAGSVGKSDMLSMKEKG